MVVSTVGAFGDQAIANFGVVENFDELGVQARDDWLPAGATMQYHEVASNPGKPDSEMVGTSGSSGERFGWAGRP